MYDHKNEVGARELLIEHQRKQTALGLARHHGLVDRDCRLGIESAVEHNANAAGTLGDEDTAVRRNRHRGRTGNLFRQHIQPEFHPVHRQQLARRLGGRVRHGMCLPSRQ